MATFTVKRVPANTRIPARFYADYARGYKNVQEFRDAVYSYFSGVFPAANNDVPASGVSEDLYIARYEENPCPEYGEVCY